MNFWVLNYGYSIKNECVVEVKAFQTHVSSLIYCIFAWHPNPKGEASESKLPFWG